MRRVVFLLAITAPVWLPGPMPGGHNPQQTTSHAPPLLRVALLGQSIIRYDLGRESPESAQQMATLLSDSDVVLTNLEAVIDEGGARSTHTGLVHRAHPEVMESLRALGINMLALSGNHSWDLGAPGVLSTIAHARRAGFAVAGTGANITEASSPGYLQTAAGAVARWYRWLQGVSSKSARGACPTRQGRPPTRPASSNCGSTSNRVNRMKKTVSGS